MPDAPLDHFHGETLQPNRLACESALNELVNSRDFVISALLATRDGRPYLFKSRDKNMHPARFSAMVGALAGLSQSVLKETTQDGLDLLLLEGQRSKLAVLKVPANNGLLVLAVMADAGTNLGLMLSCARTCAAKVNDSFGPAGTTGA
jgi:predicted regulator of Ras-like GTPase activity (Roadblock/LC7/MglB family)